MTWLQSMRGREARYSIEDVTVPINGQTLADLFVGPTTASGERVTPITAMGLPGVYRAMSLVSGSIAALPLHAYRTDDATDSRVKMRPQPRIITQPHPDLTLFEWTEIALLHLLGHGNAFLRKLTNQAGTVSELWPIDPGLVRVGRAKDGTKVYGITSDHLGNYDPADPEARELFPLTDAEILHVPGPGYDGILGLSPIQVNRQSLGLAMGSEKAAASFYGSGSMISGVLSTESRITQEQAEALKSRWRTAHAGTANAHDVAVLGMGTKFQPISIAPADAQFIENRRFSVGEIARIFGVPPHLLMDATGSTSWGSGLEQQGIAFVVYTLNPWITRLEQRLSRLLPSPQYVKFTTAGLMRGDSQQRAAFYRAMWELGVLSTNDIRRLEDMAPVPDGDGRFRPLNMGPLDSTLPLA
jgi:HK97 family phage portal protein